MGETQTGDAAVRHTSRTFVGRARELEELDAALADALAGRGTLLLVGGEAGIGKTRIAGMLADSAAAAGAAVHWGSCWEGGGAPAYWPWIQVVRSVAGQLDDEELGVRLGAGGRYLAQIVPELHDRAGDLGQPPAIDSEQARFSLFDAVVGFLRACARDRPLVVVLDDMHVADEASLLLLEFVGRTLHGVPMLVVATYRDTEARRDPEVAARLSALGRQGRAVPLRGLARAELAQLIEARAQEAPAQLVGRLHALTEGNPFFANEILALLVADGAFAGPVGPGESLTLPLPEGVRETIRRRLEPLSQAALATLTTAAVVGREFQVETLAAATGSPRNEVLEVLDEAIVAGIVTPLPQQLDRYGFSHTLTRDALYEGLSRSERERIHRLIGETLERLEGDGAHLSELAHHFFEAASAGDAAKALEYATRAGDAAMGVLAYEEAADRYGYALRTLEHEAPDERRARLLLGLGQAQLRVGNLPAARTSLQQAATMADRLHEPELYARAALSAAPWGLSTSVVDTELVALLEGALGRLDEGDSALRARLMAALARTLYWSSETGRRHELVDEAIAIARRVGDAATLGRVLGDAHIATWDPDSPQRSLPWADEMLAIADQVGDIELALDAHTWRISLLLELGDFDEMHRGIVTFEHLAAELRQPRARSYVARHRAIRALLEGRFADAQAAIEESAAIAGEVAQDDIDAMIVASQTFWVRWAQGELGDLEAAVRAFAHANPAMPAWRCALLAVYRDTGRMDDMRREFERMAADDFGMLPRDNLWLVSLALLSEACVQLGDARAAAVLEGLLEPFAQRNVVAPPGSMLAPVPRFLGMLAVARGAFDHALELFADARTRALRGNAVAVIAHLSIDESGARLRRGGPGDGEAAQRLRDEAITIASELGMEAISARARDVGEGASLPAPADASSATAAGPRAGRLAREGDVWRFEFADSSFLLKDVKGVHHLARLFAEPDAELHVLELSGAGAVAPVAPGVAAELDVRRAGDSDDAGALLDPEAKAQYRARLSELQAELDEAESFNDPERAARARDEMEFVARELSAAVGLGGRDRKAASSAERARVNVTRAIRTAIDRIREHDDALARHLDGAVVTGTFCCYRPEPGATEWTVAV